MAQNDWITVVTGYPRCGSSLMMQMLFHGGLPVHADSLVSFESRDVVRATHDGDWSFLDGCVGKAVKILEPLHVQIPTGRRYKFLLMRRDHEQQARSFLKLSRVLDGVELPPTALEAVRQSFDRDWAAMQDRVTRLGPTYVVSFEDVLAAPTLQARRAAVLLMLPGLDVPSMTRQVIPREPECLPYLLEEQKIRERERTSIRLLRP